MLLRIISIYVSESMWHWSGLEINPPVLVAHLWWKNAIRRIKVGFNEFAMMSDDLQYQLSLSVLTLRYENQLLFGFVPYLFYKCEKSH